MSLFSQKWGIFGTAHAWIFRISWETQKKFTNIVAGAPRVSSSSFARFFLQFRQDLFGFVTYGFLTVHLSDLFHLSIRGVLQLRNVVLMCISKLIKPQINLIYGRYLHKPHYGLVLNTTSISLISVSMGAIRVWSALTSIYLFTKPILNWFRNQDDQKWPTVMARAIPQTEAMFQSLFKPCIGSQGETPFSLRQGKMFSARTSNFATLTQPFQRFCAIFRLSKAPQTLLHALYCHCRRI